MPYIQEHNKKKIIEERKDPENAGELNFLITHILNSYLNWNGVCYQSFNDIIGALEGAKLEMYRRLVAGYEDGKIQDNGDVYPEKILRKCNG